MTSPPQIKQINVWFTDREFGDLRRVKDGLTWRKFILQLVKLNQIQKPKIHIFDTDDYGKIERLRKKLKGGKNGNKN